MSISLKAKTNEEKNIDKGIVNQQNYHPFNEDLVISLSFAQRSPAHFDYDLDDRLGEAINQTQRFHFHSSYNKANYFGETSNQVEESFPSSSHLNRQSMHPEQSQFIEIPEQLETMICLRSSFGNVRSLGTQEVIVRQQTVSVGSSSNSTPQTKVIKKKGDDRKNLFGHTIKTVIRAFISGNFKRIIQKILDRLNINDASAIEKFIDQFSKASMSLKRVYGLLNYQAEPDQHMKTYKQAFLVFYRWYMRHRMTAGVVSPKSKVQYKLSYLRYKNFLIYLPEITETAVEKLKTPPKKNPRSLKVVKQDLSEFDLDI